jgi:hypothetical protein
MNLQRNRNQPSHPQHCHSVRGRSRQVRRGSEGQYSPPQRPLDRTATLARLPADSGESGHSFCRPLRPTPQPESAFARGLTILPEPAIWSAPFSAYHDQSRLQPERRAGASILIGNIGGMLAFSRSAS